MDISAPHPSLLAMQVSPNHRQALQIKEMVDEKLVRDGLIGVGVLSTGALIASIAVAVLSSGRK